jgi:hypothetical protein
MTARTRKEYQKRNFVVISTTTKNLCVKHLTSILNFLLTLQSTPVIEEKIMKLGAALHDLRKDLPRLPGLAEIQHTSQAKRQPKFTLDGLPIKRKN